MPRKITNINALQDESSASGQEYCPVCGGLYSSANVLTASDVFEEAFTLFRANQYKTAVIRQALETHMETHCEFCGTETAVDKKTDDHRHSACEVVVMLGDMATDDPVACLVGLTYARHPNATIAFVASAIRFSTGSVCEAHTRLGKKFPQMAPLMGLNSPTAIDRQRRIRERIKLRPKQLELELNNGQETIRCVGRPWRAAGA